jgi:hypothetical protein
MSASLSEILGILAAICLIPSLYYGTLQDLKEFRFSKAHFNSLWVNAAYVLVILMYIFMLIEGNLFVVIEFLALSVISTLIFSFIGFRFSSGGDWRAMIYVAWIAPFLLFYVMIAAAGCAFVQAIYWVMRTDIDTPPLFRRIPFALSILCGYGLALGYFALTNL